MRIRPEEPGHVEVDQLLRDLPRGRHPRDIGTPSHACFESPKNILATESLRFNAAGNPESKLFAGVIGGTIKQGQRLPDGRLPRWVQGGTPIGIADDRHVLWVAHSRGDKGRAAMLPILFTLPATTSTLVIDPKGDQCRESAYYRAEVLGQELKVTDPFECAGPRAKKYAAAFNAIEMLQKADRKFFVPFAKLIADALIVMGEYKDKHWDETSQQVCAGLCAHVATHERYGGRRDLVTVWQLASELAVRDPQNPKQFWLEQEMLRNDAAGGSIRIAARQFYDRTGGEFSSSSRTCASIWNGYRLSASKTYYEGHRLIQETSNEVHWLGTSRFRQCT